MRFVVTHHRWKPKQGPQFEMTLTRHNVSRALGWPPSHLLHTLPVPLHLPPSGHFHRGHPASLLVLNGFLDPVCLLFPPVLH